MAGWIYLPRLLDKIRLAEAGKLHADYQPNYLYKGFDAKWLETAGLNAEEFVAVVKGTITDGEMADWVRENVEVDASIRDLFTSRTCFPSSKCPSAMMVSTRYCVIAMDTRRFSSVVSQGFVIPTPPDFTPRPNKSLGGGSTSNIWGRN